jgi:acetyl-CoA carboxylase carboxyltransferase component
MSWKPEVEEIERRREVARQMGGEERIRRQHERGKLTARERIDRLLDPGSFEEIGVLADHTSQREEMKGVSAAADGVVTGSGEIHGRPVYLFSEDFTVLGGSTGQTGLVKRVRMRELALQERVPLIYLLDGAGARAQESILGGWAGGGHFLLQSRMSGIVPQVAGILGPLGGDPALEVPLCDFKVMVKGTAMVAAGGPPLVRAAIGHEVTKEELGGYEVHTQVSGVVDNAADDDPAALDQLRCYLGYMPQSCWELPPRRESGEDPLRRDEALLEIVPRNRRQRYDMRRVIEALIDGDTFFEIQPAFGRALLVGLARIDGEVVGIQANQPMVRAGAFGAPEADKAFHFLQVCNAFNVPVVFLTDVPGFMVGPASEREGTLRRGLRVAFALAHTRVPTVSVVIRKAYGMGAVAMNGPGGGQTTTLVWPSAEFGALPVEGGVDAGYRRSIEADADAREKLEERFRAFGSPFEAAKVFNFDELIDPRDTRPRIVRALRRARARRAQSTGPWTYHGIVP